VSRLGDRAATLPALAVTVLLSGVAAAVYVGTRSVTVAMVGVALWGVDVAFFGAPARTLLQRHAAVDAHGRVLALHTTLHSWAELVAIPTTGVLAGVVGVQLAAQVVVCARRAHQRVVTSDPGDLCLLDPTLEVVTI